MKLVATRDMRYAQRKVRKGEEFEAPDRDAKILKLIKKAVDAPPIPAAPVVAHSLRTAPALAQTQTRAIEAEEEPARPARKPRATAEGDKPKAKRRYKRRDMRAED